MGFFIQKLGALFTQDLRAVFVELIRFLPGAVKQPRIIARSLCKASTRKQLVQNMLFLLAAYAVSIVLMFCKSLWAGSVYTIVVLYLLPVAALCILLCTVYNASSSGLRLILLLSIFGVMVQTAISTTTAAEVIRHHVFAVVAGVLGVVGYYFLAQLEPRCTVRLLNAFSVFLYIALLLFSSARHSAKNWLSIGSGSVQGTEITRLLAVISVVRSCTLPEKSDRLRTIAVFETIGLHLLCLVLVNELSTGVIILITGIVLLLLSVRQLRWTALGLGVTSLAGYIVYLTCKLCFQLGGGGIFKGGSLIYRKVTTRLHPGQAGDSYQIDQARQALLLSGWFGSSADTYVPVADTDFVLTSAIKTFGYSFFFVIILLMFGLLVLGLIHADQSFPGQLSLACILTLEIQFICNAASALSIGPIMGITCPFLSLGGTSLVVTFFFCGVLLAASSSLPPEKPIFFYKRGGKNE